MALLSARIHRTCEGLESSIGASGMATSKVYLVFCEINFRRTAVRELETDTLLYMYARRSLQ